jgi:methyl-accepting chemotaxis protein
MGTAMIYRNDALDRQRALAARVTFALIAVVGIASVATDALAQGKLGVATLGALGSLAAAAIILWARGTACTLAHAGLGIVLMVQVSWAVAAASGHPWQADLHMAYFAALAALVAFSDWRVVAAGTVAVALHHLGFGLLASAVVFPGDGSFARIVLHAVILLTEAVALGWVTMSGNATMKSSNEARREAELAYRKVEESNAARAAASADLERQRQAAHDVERQTMARRDAAVSLIGEGLARLASRDLTARLDPQMSDDYRDLFQDFNRTAQALEATLRAISSVAADIRGGTDEISQAAEHFAQRTERQASDLERAASNLGSIDEGIRSAAERVAHATTIVAGARSDAESSGSIVALAVSAMSEIKGSSARIGQITSVIDEIAFQTNLLALNAGVEAARAGDAGRGFAVVAQEVRALAQRSADAAKEIKALIDISSRNVETGVRHVGDTGQVLQRIVASFSSIDQVVAEIAGAVRDHAARVGGVSATVSEIDRATQESAAMIEQSTAATYALRDQITELAAEIGRFVVQSGAVAQGGRRAA